MPALLISMWASWNVKTTFSKYNRIGNRRGYTGAMVARRILDMNGLQHIRIERVSGSLTDHFDPSAGVIRLSDSTYSSTSVGALGVAAHECGHAVQHDVGYFPIRIRQAIIPLTQFGSTAAMPLALLGVVLGLPILIEAGIFLFSAVVAFQLVTLPVEFNASRRAMKTLENDRILDDDELKGSRKVLTAAALTYVAALLVALGNLLRLMSMRDRRR
ncbi:MAG: zinc metallopeptidase [Oscillospiraceae bacterium]|nr:zinc metallopeptidase [Oscillospiraceae bacterium]